MGENELSLSDYLVVLRRRWWIVASVFLGCVALAFLWSILQTPRYRATVRVLVDTDSAAEIFDPSVAQARGARAMANEAEVARSTEVRDLALATIADTVAPESVSFAANVSSDADVLLMSAVALSGVDAAAAAQAFADAYILERREQVVQEFLETAEVVSDRLELLEGQLAALPEDSSAQRRSLEAQVVAFGDALLNLNVSADLGGSRATVVAPARVPASAFAPQTSQNIGIGVVLGLILGVALALLANALDDSLSSKDDVERATGGVPNLAVVPAVRDWRDRAETVVVAIDRPNSQESEAYRTLRAALEFALIDSDAKVLQVTSAKPGEGKTTTAVNLAITTARSGKRVILVDADLRKPRIHAFFDKTVEPGFTNLLLGMAKVDEVMHDVDRGAGSLGAICTGPLPPGPSELLGSVRAGTILKELASLCDFVIVDSTPVLPVSDALVLAKQVDATILVANGSRTSMGELSQATDLLNQVDANLIGTVLNQVSRGQGGYGYGYGYGYGNEEDQGKS